MTIKMRQTFMDMMSILIRLHILWDALRADGEFIGNVEKIVSAIVDYPFITGRSTGGFYEAVNCWWKHLKMVFVVMAGKSRRKGLYGQNIRRKKSCSIN